jgi:hypothetical protein
MTHFVKDVKYLSEYKLLLTFADDSLRQVDLAPHFDGEVFEPMKDMSSSKAFISTLIWIPIVEEWRRHVPGFPL